MEITERDGNNRERRGGERRGEREKGGREKGGRERERERERDGVLSPVNHKGFHQGLTQTSLYLRVIDFTSRHTISHVCFVLFCVCVFFWWVGVFLFLFLAYLYFAGTQHENLHPAR